MNDNSSSLLLQTEIIIFLHFHVTCFCIVSRKRLSSETRRIFHSLNHFSVLQINTSLYFRITAKSNRLIRDRSITKSSFQLQSARLDN